MSLISGNVLKTASVNLFQPSCPRPRPSVGDKADPESVSKQGYCRSAMWNIVLNQLESDGFI